jgi:hypothetical protein
VIHMERLRASCSVSDPHPASERAPSNSDHNGMSFNMLTSITPLGLLKSVLNSLLVSIQCRDLISAMALMALIVPCALAAIGDSAPAIPSSYLTSHPRLP